MLYLGDFEFHCNAAFSSCPALECQLPVIKVLVNGNTCSCIANMSKIVEPVGATNVPVNLEDYIRFCDHIWDKHKPQPTQHFITTQKYTDIEGFLRLVDSGSLLKRAPKPFRAITIQMMYLLSSRSLYLSGVSEQMLTGLTHT